MFLMFVGVITYYCILINDYIFYWISSQETRGTVYNCTATFDVKLSIGDVIQIGRGIIDKLPLTNVMWWLKEPRLVKNKTYFRILMLTESVVVAALIDIAMKIKGQKPV